MTQRKRDPIIKCRYCGKKMKRKRIGKRLESRSAFRKRKFCDRECYARDILKNSEGEKI